MHVRSNGDQAASFCLAAISCESPTPTPGETSEVSTQPFRKTQSADGCLSAFSNVEKALTTQVPMVGQHTSATCSCSMSAPSRGCFALGSLLSIVSIYSAIFSCMYTPFTCSESDIDERHYPTVLNVTNAKLWAIPGRSRSQEGNRNVGFFGGMFLLSVGPCFRFPQPEC